MVSNMNISFGSQCFTGSITYIPSLKLNMIEKHMRRYDIGSRINHITCDPNACINNNTAIFGVKIIE